MNIIQKYKYKFYTEIQISYKNTNDIQKYKYYTGIQILYRNANTNIQKYKIIQKYNYYTDIQI